MQDISFLEKGGEQQRKAYDTLVLAEVFDQLKVYLPRLVGPYAFDLAKEDTPISIACEVYAIDQFRETCERLFEKRSRFAIVEKPIAGEATMICRFKENGLMFEISGQARPVNDQIAFKVTEVQKRLLGHSPRELDEEVEELTDEDLQQTRYQLRTLLDKGMSHEKAFAKTFSIPGEPFVVLTDLFDVDDDRLIDCLRKKAQRSAPSAS